MRRRKPARVNAPFLSIRLLLDKAFWTTSRLRVAGGCLARPEHRTGRSRSDFGDGFTASRSGREYNIDPNHGWRHWFKTVAREAGVEDSVIDAIVGHAPATVGGRYGSVTMQTMSKACRCHASTSGCWRSPAIARKRSSAAPGASPLKFQCSFWSARADTRPHSGGVITASTPESHPPDLRQVGKALAFPGLSSALSHSSGYHGF